MVTPSYPPLPALEDLLSAQGTEHLSLFAKHALNGPLAGYHRSPLKGFSVEFAEHRAYSPGDSLRRLDWKRLAKTDKMLLKTTDAETNLQCRVVLDRSGSMRTDHKLAFSILCMALLGEALGNQRDALGLTYLDGRGGTEAFPCKSSKSHRLALYQSVLQDLRTGTDIPKRTPLSETLHQLAESMPRRSMVVVFSDFWEPESDGASPWDALQKALEHLRQRQHWVLLFPVFGPAEQELSFENAGSWSELTDAETGEKLVLLPHEAQLAYQQAFDARLDSLRRLQQPPQLQVHPLSTADHPLHGLLPFFLAHQKMK